MVLGFFSTTCIIYHSVAVLTFEVRRELERFQIRYDTGTLRTGRELDQQFKQDDGQGVNVDFVVVRIGRDLFGTHVEPSADLVRVILARQQPPALANNLRPFLVLLDVVMRHYVFD